MQSWKFIPNITHRRLAVSLVAVALAVGAGLSLVGCGGDEEGDQAAVEPTMTTAPQPEPTAEPAAQPTPAPEERRPWSFEGQRDITTVFPPADLDLYRSLLPEPFDMPDQPLVIMRVVEYYDVTEPLVPYSEGFVAIQSEYQGRTGLYFLTMPVDDETANMGGRSIGFPKYVADEITLGEQEGGWTGRVVHEGRTAMEVIFTASAARFSTSPKLAPPSGILTVIAVSAVGM